MAFRPVACIVCTNAEIIADYVGLPADSCDLDEVIDCAFTALERAALEQGIATRYEPQFRDWRGGRYDSSRFPSVEMEGHLVIITDREKAIEVMRVANAFYRTLNCAAANAKETV